MAQRRSRTAAARMWRAWRRKQERIKNLLVDTHIHRVLGERLFKDYLWIHDKRAIAGGFTLGLFVALTPTIPFQMLICAFGALYFKVNLPIALVMCWVTNPLTAIPIYAFSYGLGRNVMENTFLLRDALDLYSFDRGLARVIRHAVYLSAGSLIVASSAALVANITIRLLWTVATRYAARRRRAKNSLRRNRASIPPRN